MSTPALIGAALGPLFALLIFGVFALAVKLAIARYMPDCWIKRQLLAERFKTKYSAANRRIAQEASKRLRRRS